jgi:hypothetical protein
LKTCRCAASSGPDADRAVAGRRTLIAKLAKRRERRNDQVNLTDAKRDRAMRSNSILCVLVITSLLAACASTDQQTPERQGPADDLEMMQSLMQQLTGEASMSPAEVERLSESSEHPLGAFENPVRANMPAGQRAYLRRLRCADGRAPSFERLGSYGSGPYGSVVDGYEVDCGEAAPGQVMIYMDMYHRHVEAEATPGFEIVDP